MDSFRPLNDLIPLSSNILSLRKCSEYLFFPSGMFQVENETYTDKQDQYIISKLVSHFLFKTKKHDFFGKFDYANEIKAYGRISQNTRRAKFIRQRN
jgi:hypothetical protein